MEISEAASSRFVDAAGVRIHYNELGPADGPAVVFLHGGGPGCTGWSDFRSNAPAFAEQYRCLLIDLPQYGKSAKVAIEGGTLAFISGVIRAGLDTLGIEQAHFVCQSYGGAVALKIVADAPARVRSLVLTGSAPTGGILQPLPQDAVAMEAVGGYYAGGPTPEKMRTLLARYEWFNAAKIPDETVEMRYQASIDPEGLALMALAGSRGSPEDLTAVLGQNSVPTYLIWGDHDRFTGPDMPLFLFTRMQNARLTFVKNASHHLQEEYPDLYNSLVLPWIAENL